MDKPLLSPLAPSWAEKVARVTRSATASVQVLWGNTYDLVPLETSRGVEYGSAAQLLSEQVFARYDLVLYFDMSRGLVVFAGSDAARQQKMIEVAGRAIESFTELSGRTDPALVMVAMNRFFRMMTIAELSAKSRFCVPEGNQFRRLRVALLIDHASFVFPESPAGQLSSGYSQILVTLINWATSVQMKSMETNIVLIDESRQSMSARLLSNPHVVATEVGFPDEAQRLRYLESPECAGLAAVTDITVSQVAALSSGLSLTNLRSLVRPAISGASRLSAATFADLRKKLIEQQCLGLLEFVQPKWGIDSVVGFTAAKKRLMDDSALLARGKLDCMPMGYLLCGPVGTGKSFLAQCAARDFGIPVVTLKNFRSKYVGESESNLERILGVLRVMGPIMVIVDEADAALGDRESDGDSGTSSRIFGAIATQMGDTAYRGKIIWMLLTARPDLLPIDLKRQGRAEVHIPLLYTREISDLRQMFVVLARKVGTKLDEKDLPSELKAVGDLSGSDIEGMIVRAHRLSSLADLDHIGAEQLAGVIAGFMPSTQTLERELQEIAALVECTDREFLDPYWAARIEEKGREGLQQRYLQLKAMLAS